MSYEPIKNDEMDSDTRKEIGQLTKNIDKEKNPIKVILNKVKTFITIMMAFAKILLPILLGSVILVLFTGFHIILDDDPESGETNTDEEYNSTVTNEAGGIDITDSRCILTESQIIDFINEYEDADESLKQALINRIDEILKWQQDTGYSAAFIITVAFRENRNDLDNFFVEMNTKGAEWNEKGYKTTKEIAEDYVGDESWQEWANIIENNISQKLHDAGVIETGEIAMSGDGYPNSYVSKSGRTYRNYKQNMGSYANQKWCGTSIVKDDGCSLIAVTIVISGYRNSEINPLELANKYAIIGSGMDIPAALRENNINYNMPLGVDIEYTNGQKNTIKNYVAGGKPAIIKVISPSTFTTSTHYMVLLDYNSSTNEFYLSNPYIGNNTYGKTGWVPADEVLYKCTRFYSLNI